MRIKQNLWKINSQKINLLEYLIHIKLNKNTKYLIYPTADKLNMYVSGLINVYKIHINLYIVRLLIKRYFIC